MTKSPETIEILLPDMPEYQEKSEFLRRELRLVGKKVNHLENSSIPRSSVIYCNDINHWESRLLLSEPKSIIAIVACNEYYDKQTFEKVNNFPSLKSAFLEYLPAQNHPRLMSLALFVLKNPLAMFKRRFWGTLRIGFNNWKDCKNLNFLIPVFEFPLGYSERFVGELERLGSISDSESSLFDLDSPIRFENRKLLSFFGQRGTWYRRYMIEYFQRRYGGFETYSGFGGNPGEYQGSSYARELFSAKFILNPPGNRSSLCARYFETIICGGIPVITEISIQCWINHNYWPNKIPWKHSDFKRMWRTLKTFDDSSAININDELRSYSKSNLQQTREKIENAINEIKAGMG